MVTCCFCDTSIYRFFLYSEVTRFRHGSKSWSCCCKHQSHWKVLNIPMHFLGRVHVSHVSICWWLLSSWNIRFWSKALDLLLPSLPGGAKLQVCVRRGFKYRQQWESYDTWTVVTCQGMHINPLIWIIRGLAEDTATQFFWHVERYFVSTSHCWDHLPFGSVVGDDTVDCCHLSESDLFWKSRVWSLKTSDSFGCWRAHLCLAV